MKNKNRLPDKPSELILAALADLTVVARKTRTYRVNMGEWHNPHIGNKCNVCLAGSVIANRLMVSPGEDAYPGIFDNDTRLKLRALNTIRSGNIQDFLFNLPTSPTHPAGVPVCVPVAIYEASPKNFRRDLRRIAAMLAKAGL